jgi:cytochrome c-type biogenesis protein CcmE
MTDAGSVDLTPRAGRPTGRKAWVPIAILVAIVLAVAGLIWFLVTNSQSFLEADVAVAERQEQGERRFQLLGSPIQDSAEVEGRTVVVAGQQYAPFTVAFDGIKVDVLSQEIPPDLFNCGVPVVLEGSWVMGPAPSGVEWPVGANDGWYFETDRILVKHDNDYTEDRILDAEERGLIEVESVPVSPDSACQV